MRARLLAVAGLAGGLCAPVFATQIGSLQGQFSASPSGAASYTIPISAPGATAGLAPHVVLQYSSRGGNGLVGVGWQLAGLSLIARCPPVIARDGSTGSLTFSSTDRLCLDGQPLLVKTGTYWIDGSTYVSEQDNTLLVTAHASGGAGATPTTGPQWVEVRGPHGNIYEYGKTADSEVAVTLSGQFSSTTAVRLWALDRITDPAGNSIVFHYTQQNGNLRPTRINYTYHNGSGATHRVTFQYENLSGDEEPIYHNTGGAQIEVDHLLQNINVQYLSGGSWSNVLSYELTYDSLNTSTHRARLAQVQECANNGDSCFSPTHFVYRDGIAGLDLEGGTSTDIVTQDCPVQNTLCGGGGGGGGGGGTTATGRFAHVMDVNGDGLPDLLMPGGGTDSGTWWLIENNGSGFETSVNTGIDDTNYFAAQSLYYNEDAKADLLTASTDGDWTVLQAKSTGDGFTSVDTGIPDSGDRARAIALDFNGDGLTDLVYLGTSGDSGQGLHLVVNQGGSFQDNGTVLNDLNGISGVPGGGLGGFGFASVRGSQIDAVADFNGDGRNDLLIKIQAYQMCLPDGCKPVPEGTYWVAYGASGGHWDSDSGQWQCPASGSNQCRYRELGLVGGGADPGVPPIAADIQGDGLTDVVFPQGGHWHVYFSTGKGFTDVDTGIAYVESEYKYALVLDWNGDGKEDVLIPRSGNFYLMRSTGADLSAPTDTGIPVPGNAEEGSYRMGDINGSGLAGLLWAEDDGNGNASWHYRPHKGLQADLLTGVTDGLGNTVAISYGDMITTDAYTAGSGASYPQADLMAPMPLVTTVTRNDGIGGTYDVSYNYLQARANLHGRGFLGFGEVKVTDSRTSITTTTTYRQDWPWIGQPDTVEVTEPGGAMLNEITDTWSTISGTGPATVPVLLKQVNKTYGISGSSSGQVIKTVTRKYSNFDAASGSPGKTVATTTGGGDTFKTVTTVAYDDGTGCLGLPRSVTVTETETTTNGTESASRKTNYGNDLSYCRVNQVTVDPNGGNMRLAKTFGYDQFGNVHEMTLSASTLSGGTRVTDYGYDSSGAFLRTTTRYDGDTDVVTTENWDKGLGVQTGAVDPNGNTTTMAYDDFGRLKKKTQPTGASVTITRTGCGSCGVANAAYEVTATRHDAAGHPGGSETSVYDSLGRKLRMMEPRKEGKIAISDMTYDALGRKTDVSAPYYQGDTVYWAHYQYDLKNRPVQIMRDLSGGRQKVTKIKYDGLESDVTAGYGSPLARETVYQYDVLGRKTTVTDADFNTTHYTYTAFGQMDTITDPAGNLTSYAYNERGFKIGSTDPDLGAQSWSYDAAGEVLSHTDARGKTIAMTYDALGRPASRQMPDARGGTDATNWTYDTVANGIGRLSTVTETKGDGQTFNRSYTYTSIGEVAEVSTGIGSDSYTVSRTYDGFGRVKTVSYPDAPNVDHAPVANAGPDQTVTLGVWATPDGSDSYDVDNGQTLSYHWSIVSGPLQSTLTDTDQPTAHFASHSYGSWTLKLTVSDGIKSASDTMQVDVAPPAPGGLSATPATSTDGNYTLSWNAVSGADNYRLLESKESATNGDQSSPCTVYFGTATSKSFTLHPDGTYDYTVESCANGACGVPSSSATATVTHSQGTTSACTGAVGLGSEASNAASAPGTDNGGLFTVRYVYDSNGMLSKVENDSDLSQVYWQAESQAAGGGLTSALLGNGLEVSRNFNASNGRLLALGVGTGASTPVVSLAYHYDLLGEVDQRASLTDGLEQDFVYDPLGRVTQATLYHNGTQSQGLHYTYDAVGNLKTRTGVGTYTYGGVQPHAVTAVSGGVNASYSYDAAGEMTSGAGRTYQWTAAGKPWKITESASSDEFRYGPGGRVYREVRRDAMGNATTVTTPGPYFQVTESGGTTTLENNILVGNTVVAVFKVSGTGVPLGLEYLHRDRLGSVIAVTDGGGQVLARSAWGVWGQRVNPATWKGASPDEGTLAYSRKGYTGHEQLKEVGLIHMGGRVYDPAIGRFVSADPTLQAPYTPQDLNRYSYVLNSPLAYTDPTGYSFWGDLLDPIGLFGGDGALGTLDSIVDALGHVLGKVGHGLEHLGQEVKTYWKVIVVIVAAVFTAGIAAAALMVYFGAETVAALTLAQALAVGAVSGAVAGGIMGAGMTLAYGGSLGDALSNGLRGAAVGAFAGAVTMGAGRISAGWNFAGQAAAHGVAGGLTGVVSGGSFKKGFELAVVAYGAVAVFHHFVHEDPRLMHGKNAVYEGKGTQQTQDNIQFGLQNQATADHAAGTIVTSPCGAWCEGGSISKVFNYIGFNGTSALHDVWMDSLPGWANYLAMLPAAGVAFFGSVDSSPIGAALMGSDIVNEYGRR